MILSLIQAQGVVIGDLIEHPTEGVWKPVDVIHKQYGRLYFLMGPNRIISRSALVDDFVTVGRTE